MSRNPSRQLPSLLEPWQRGLLGVALVVAAFVLANSGYLLLNRLADLVGWGYLSVGETRLPEFFQVMVLTHSGAGLLLAALMLVFFVAHLPTVWRRRHRGAVLSGIAFVSVGLVLVITGLFILTAASSEENRWAWWGHVLAAALVPIGYVVHRLVGHARPARARFRRFGAAVAVLVGALAAGHGLALEGPPGEDEEMQLDRLAREAGARDRDVERFASGEFVPPGFVPPESPFFPSAATTSSGDLLPAGFLTRRTTGVPAERVAREVEQEGFVDDAPIGAETCARCHPDVVAQWESSAHRFASFNNPFYAATVDDMRENAREPNPWIERHRAAFPDRVTGVGRGKSKWCGACHDPALLLTGRMGGEVDRTSRAAQAGLTCLACHAVDTIHDVTGNGNYNVADDGGDPYLFADAAAGTPGAFLHDAAMKAKPGVHRRRMLDSSFGEAEFCATCHKVSLREPVNNYRWLRGQDEYDAWHDSGIARNASRTFYLPARTRNCQDCHMPRVPAERGDVAAEDGTVRSHRFLAANTALPWVRGDSAALRRTESFLRDGKLRVDVFALRRDGPDGRGTELHTPVDAASPALRPGERVTVDVVVRNQGVGHTFPGGTNDSNQGWLEVTLLDGDGKVLARSGGMREDGRVDPMAHAYRAVVLDGESRRIDRRNAQDIHVTAAANVIGPGTADVARYEFAVPGRPAGGRVVVRARLLWRKFDRTYTEFAYRENPEGFRRFDEVPDLPVTEIAADEAVLEVGGRGAADRRPAARSDERATGDDAGVPDWVRHNDYGIGLLLQGDARLARRAFRRVAELEPDRIDGPLNIARAALREGDLDEAYDRLEEVEEIERADPRAAWVWGRALQADGRYEDAALAYRRALERFPEDRAAWRNLGRVLYLDGRYDRALSALDSVLAIDPEDRAAHYFRMLTLRAQDRDREAEAAEAAFEYFRVDESARALTRSYRAENPGVNLMAQPIHSHRLQRASTGEWEAASGVRDGTTGGTDGRGGSGGGR